jgi:peptidoglycan/LPS O-acetylase OafA/YrhL
MDRYSDASDLPTVGAAHKKVQAFGSGVGTPEDVRQHKKQYDQLSGIYGLRAIAALMIVLFHLVYLAPNVRMPEALSVIKTHFGLGVPLFFVLSGFSLMYSTSRYVGRERWVQIFLIKRFFRIAPLFYVMVAFFILYNFFVGHLMPSPALISINMLFLFNLVPGNHESVVWAGWTLGVEMLFYALFPILLITVTSFRRGLFLLVLSLLASIAAQDLLTAKGQGAYASMSLVVNAPYFIAGITAFFIFKRFALIKLNPLMIGMLCVSTFTIVIGTIVFNMTIGGYIYAYHLYIGVWALVFSLLCVWQGLYPSRLLSSTPFQFCGERSYSIYLVHAIIVVWLAPIYTYLYEVVGNDAIAFLLSAAVGLTVVLCAASIMFRLVEMPGIKLGALIIANNQRGSRYAIPRTLPAVPK